MIDGPKQPFVLPHRRVVQISSAAAGDFVKVFALCDDGSTWSMEGFSSGHLKWVLLPEVPQPVAKTDGDVGPRVH